MTGCCRLLRTLLLLLLLAQGGKDMLGLHSGRRFTGAVQLLGAFEDDSHIYLVQESCAGAAC